MELHPSISPQGPTLADISVTVYQFTIKIDRPLTQTGSVETQNTEYSQHKIFLGKKFRLREVTKETPKSKQGSYLEHSKNNGTQKTQTGPFKLGCERGLFYLFKGEKKLHYTLCHFPVLSSRSPGGWGEMAF